MHQGHCHVDTAKRGVLESVYIAFSNLWLAVVISFGCYIPVVLFADAVPMVGMLMIPKTCAYVWVVLIGYKAMNEEARSVNIN